MLIKEIKGFLSFLKSHITFLYEQRGHFKFSCLFLSLSPLLTPKLSFNTCTKTIKNSCPGE